MTRYWVIAPYEAADSKFDDVWQFDLKNGVISIGWESLGDIFDYDQAQLKAAYERTFPGDIPGNVTRKVNMLWNFYHEIAVGDIVIARRGTKRIAAVGVVKNTAHFDATRNEGLFEHCSFIDIQWKDMPRDRIFDRVAFGIQTLYEIGETEYNTLVGEDDGGISIDETIEEGIIKDRKRFILEKYLEEFIVANFDAIFDGRLVLFRDEQGKAVGRQYRVDVGIIDILAIESATNSIVVIELKKGRESDVVVGQILRYIGWVSENLCTKDQMVKGMIICEGADDRLYYAIKATQNIEAKYYQIDFKLSDTPTVS